METCRFIHGVFLKNTKEGRFLKKIGFRMFDLVSAQCLQI